jgi:hypothetical protein
MAGSGFKVWADEEPLYAADLMGYLMEQTVMVFATTAARDAAIAVPTEGMITYTKDDNVIRYFDGTLWNAIGEITAGSGISVSESTSSFTISLNVDAKGDLLVGTANDTVARLPIGADGQVLGADSSTSTGVSWVDGFSWSEPLDYQDNVNADKTITGSDSGQVIYVNTSLGDVNIFFSTSTVDPTIKPGMQFLFVIVGGSNDLIFQGIDGASVLAKGGYTSATGAGSVVTALYYYPTDVYYLIGDLG